MKTLRAFFGGVLAGISVSLGGLVFLSLDNKVLGAVFFTIGLFTVCSFGLNLFTGKVCYVFENDKTYALMLIPIYLGNMAGTGISALAAHCTRNAEAWTLKAQSMCETKLSDSLLSLFFLGMLCNILIYIAVEGYKSIPHGFGKYLALFFGVTVFILAGTEHCVADMFYFWMAGLKDLRVIPAILVITAGNSCGGVLFPLLRKIQNGHPDKQEGKA